MDFNSRYSKIKLLDTGGMAKVYLGKDKETNKQVAIKVLDPEIARNIVYKKRFLAEIKLTQKIDSAFVVKASDLHWDKQIQFYVMDYVSGRNLREIVAERGMLTEKEALRYAAQIALGLEAMHNCDIIHRDIKPQNIMIDERNLVKIVDLGIARNEESEDLTKTGVIIGSVQYVAPEILDGQNATIKSDIYSLGILIYFMIRGQVPFNHENDYQIIKMHKKDNLPEMNLFSNKVAKLIRAMTAKNPDYRPKDMLMVFKYIDKIREK